MSTEMWIGILGSVMLLGFFLNGLRLVRGPKGHGANAGSLHMAVSVITLPIVWVMVAMSSA
ncbi:MAG: hypothetical protein AAF687_05275 [Pseudomonadota bacterium]